MPLSHALNHVKDCSTPVNTLLVFEINKMRIIRRLEDKSMAVTVAAFQYEYL